MIAPPAPAAGENSRLIGLDLLRLLAVVLVLGRHAESPPENWDSFLRPAFDAWNRCGGLGVDLFLVLSGFLVSGLLFAEYKKRGDISLSRFYVRRAWKIYPAFYALIAFTYIFSRFLDFRMLDSQAKNEIFFLQNYRPGYWNHTWSLALEEHFYILLPLVLLTLVRRHRGAANPFRALPYLVAASSVLFLAVRMINFALRTEYSFNTHVFATHLRMDSLFFGVGVAYAYHFHQESFARIMRPVRHAMIALGAATLTTSLWLRVPMTPFYIHTLGFTQFYLGAAALMVGVLMCRIPVNRATRWLAALGTYSYSIYLWHMAFMRWVVPLLANWLSWQERQAVYFVSAFVIGVAMAKLIELPLLRLRDRKYPSRSEIVAAAPEAGRVEVSVAA